MTFGIGTKIRACAELIRLDLAFGAGCTRPGETVRDPCCYLQDSVGERLPTQGRTGLTEYHIFPGLKTIIVKV